MKNYYEILGINWTASDEEIKTAFHVAVKKYHPDVTEFDEDCAFEKLQDVMEAYQILRDHKKRMIYNVKLGADWTKDYVKRHETVNNILEELGKARDWWQADSNEILRSIVYFLAAPFLIMYCFEFWKAVLVLLIGMYLLVSYQEHRFGFAD